MRFAFEGLLEGMAMRPPVGRDPLPTAVLGFADEPPVPDCLVTLFFMLCSKKKALAEERLITMGGDSNVARC